MLPSIFGKTFGDFFGRTCESRSASTESTEKSDENRRSGKTIVICWRSICGFKKDEISVDVENGYLTISAAKGLDKEKKDKKGRYIRQERYAGSLSRCFYIGDKKPEDVKAKYEDGILTVSFPKESPKALPDSKKVTIE
ncbi:MAG: Hsp20/alpha crystallin family protein [Anaerovoracaceae bacterium]